MSSFACDPSSGSSSAGSPERAAVTRAWTASEAETKVFCPLSACAKSGTDATSHKRAINENIASLHNGRRTVYESLIVFPFFPACLLRHAGWPFSLICRCFRLLQTLLLAEFERPVSELMSHVMNLTQAMSNLDLALRLECWAVLQN